MWAEVTTFNSKGETFSKFLFPWPIVETLSYRRQNLTRAEKARQLHSGMTRRAPSLGDNPVPQSAGQGEVPRGPELQPQGSCPCTDELTHPGLWTSDERTNNMFLQEIKEGTWEDGILVGFSYGTPFLNCKTRQDDMFCTGTAMEGILSKTSPP